VDLVVDASIAFKWLVTEADSEAAVSLLQSHNIVAPDVLLAECRNAALTHVRRGLISIEQAKQAERDLEALQLHTLPSTPFLTHAFTLALELSHPIYDCIYLAAAIASDRILITADERFAAKVQRSLEAADRIKILADLRD
jgi:predicted nucleic acid-binding protein